jgi:DNA-binding response OmpR family regulator
MDEATSCQILVVSNFPDWEFFTNDRLARGGYPDDEVCFAGNGQEGLIIAQQAPLDVIIYYLWTLDVDGYEFCRRVRALPGLQGMPILLEGAVSPALVYPEAQRVGAAGYLRQPTQVEDLVAARNAVLRGETYYPSGVHKPMEWETPTDEEGCQVLVIDDKPGIGDMAQLVLGRGRNDRVRYANGGRKGVVAAEHDPPRLIILNIAISGLDGVEVYQRIRAVPALAHTPVLFQVAWAPERSYPAAQEVGAAGCLTLPYSPQELLAARDAALRGEMYYP